MFSEILPYLEILANEENENQDIEVPDIRNISIAEAKKKLKEVGLEIKLTMAEGETITGDEIVKEQLPKPGLRIKSSNKVEAYYK